MPAQRWAFISLLFVGLMFSLPFLQYHHNYPLPGFYGEWLAALLGLAALGLLVQRRWWEDFSLPRIALVPLALFAVLLGQLALGMAPYPQQILLAELYLLWACGLMVLGHVLKAEFGWEKLAHTLAVFLLAGGVLNALAGLLQHYNWHTIFDAVVSMKVSSSVYGNLAQPNHFADYLALALVSALFLHARGLLRKAFLVPCAALLLFTMALSGSRSSWLYLFAIAASAAGWHRAEGSAASRRAWYGALALLAGFVLAQVLAQLPALAPAHSPVLTAAQRLLMQAEDPSGSIRFYLWSEAWRMFLQAPLLGLGWGQFPWQHFSWLEQLNASSVTGWYSHAHNFVAQLAAETGLAGLVPVLLGLGYWLLGLRRAAVGVERWWLLTLMAVLLIHSLLEAPLWFAYFLGIAAFLLGAGEAHGVRIDLRRIGRPAMVLMLAFGAAAAFNLESNYRSLEGMLFARYDSASQARADGANLAGKHAALMKIHQESLLTPYIELAYAGAITLDRDHLRDKLDLNTRAMRFAPVGDAVYRQAVLLALAGEDEAARRQLERAARAYPDHLKVFAMSLRQLAEKEPARFAGMLEWMQQEENASAVRAK
ncbi:MAG: Wzy polymerase domain-containing protein [Pseudomonadota bacterium]